DLENHIGSWSDTGVKVATPPSSAAEVASAEAHPAAEVAPALASCLGPVAETARFPGAGPAPVTEAAECPAQQLADEETREESSPAERHEVAAGPRAEVSWSAPVREPTSA